MALLLRFIVTTKQEFLVRVTALVGCLMGGAVANAVPVTYDFTGTGILITYTGVSSTNVASAQTYTGWVTIDVIAPGPSGSDSYSGPDNATDLNGWVQSDFFIDWGSGSFNPAAVPGLSYADMFAQVQNGSSSDALYNRELYQGEVDGTLHVSHAYLNRYTNSTWLSDLSFDQSVGLAPGGTNYLAFADYSRTLNYVTGSSDFVGHQGSFNLSSLTARTTSVPEPGALALFGLGLAGLGLMRRRRVTEDSAPDAC